jgi:hypothetical protein
MKPANDHEGSARGGGVCGLVWEDGGGKTKEGGCVGSWREDDGGAGEHQVVYSTPYQYGVLLRTVHVQ